MTEMKLKPCPFCGGKASIFGGALAEFVACNECGVETPGDDTTRDAAARMWNRRAVNSHEAMLEALEALLHAVCGESGFANVVRQTSGFEYPWPALDYAEEKARAAIATAKGER